jgi:L-rhamnose-H+ transport protein
MPKASPSPNRQRPPGQLQPTRAPTLANYLFSALAGTTWYMQFFFYTMGETKMGRFKFSSWTLRIVSIIIFSTL